MRIKHVIRYYCDFCPRGYFKKPSMERHERGCTANPNRVCGLCEYAEPSLKQKPIAELIDCLMEGKSSECTSDIKQGMAKLRQLTEGCPGCILAAIRQSGIMKALYDSEYGPPELNFDFKKELEQWWATANEAKSEIQI
jgi:hypothetical protein